ncbi:MAG TPA: phage tail protein [Pedomonas sp.]
MSVASGLSVIGGVLGLGPKIPRPSADVSPQSYRQAVGQASIIYGRARVGGLISFYHAVQGAEDYRYFVIAIAGHPIRAVTKVYLNDEQVTLDASGKVISGRYANAAWIWPELGGENAVASAIFVSECGGRWTSAHRGQGIAKLYCKFHLTEDVVAEGFPNITVEVEGKADVYDPRTGMRGYTNNAILCIYDWLRLPRADGGFGIDDDEVDWDFVASQANICDEPVPLRSGGLERRYTLDGVITTGAAPDEIRDSLLTSCAGEFTDSGGVFKVHAGAYREASARLEEGDLAASIRVAPLSPGDQIANEVRGTFNDPAQKYQPTEYPSRALVTTDDQRTLDLDLPFTKSHTMAQRIAKIMLMRASAERTVTWPMNLKGLAVEALDTVTLATHRYGLANYAWKVESWNLSEDFSVVLQLREESPDFYEWDPIVDEQDLPRATGTIQQPAGALTGAGGPPTGMVATASNPTQIQLDFTLPATPMVVGFEIWRSTTNSFATASLVLADVGYPNMEVSEPMNGLADGTTYYFWARARFGTGGHSPMATAAATTL